MKSFDDSSRPSATIRSADGRRAPSGDAWTPEARHAAAESLRNSLRDYVSEPVTGTVVTDGGGLHWLKVDSNLWRRARVSVDKTKSSYITWAELKEKYAEIKKKKKDDNLSFLTHSSVEDLSDAVRRKIDEFERFTELERSEPMALYAWSMNQHPTTIVQARYGGAYEGAPWLAFPYRLAGRISTHWDASDVPCAKFWSEVDSRDFPVGRGTSPSEALLDLTRRVSEFFDTESYSIRVTSKVSALARLTWFSADTTIPLYIAQVCQLIIDKGQSVPSQWSDLTDPVTGLDILHATVSTLKELAEAATDILNDDEFTALSTFYEALAEAVELGCLWD